MKVKITTLLLTTSVLFANLRAMTTTKETTKQIDLSKTLYEAKVSQYSLAISLGIADCQINKWCRGKHYPRKMGERALIDYFNKNNITIYYYE